MGPESGPDAAWGLRFPSLAREAGHVLLEAPAWEPVELDLRLGLEPEIDDGRGHWNAEDVYMALPAGGLLEITWPYAVTLTLPTRPAQEFVVQPFLATAASCIAVNSGRQAFHAGAVVVNGGAWVILGAKGAGKSTALGRMHQMGIDVLTDDVLICDGLEALAGPRCVDLRQGPAQHLGIGKNCGKVGLRERWRVHLRPCSPRVALRGWIELEWASEERITAIPAIERLPLLYQGQSLRLPAHDPEAFLELCSLPAYRWSRVKKWEGLDRSVDVLLSTIS